VKSARFILITILTLAYSVALAHNFIPHQHESKTQEHHHHHDNHHHDDNNNNNNKTNGLADLLSEFVHHPSAKFAFHLSQGSQFQKVKSLFEYIAISHEHVPLNRISQLGYETPYQTHWPPNSPIAYSLLRAPPVI
jgi:hypothetical protein